ncbi:helix-turn-helix domain-containing protein [Pedobacter sp. AW1-32]|uniref:helix-turn-helix domain-containing protein n=1 Tax=Pedobacter sp. AW1-32 TaxID=3383026 RepID=UPI003FF03307
MVHLQTISGKFKRDHALNVEYPMRIFIVQRASGFLCMNSGDYDLLDQRIFFVPEEGLIRLEGAVETGFVLSFSSAVYNEFLLQHLDPSAKNLFQTLSFRDLDAAEFKRVTSLLSQLKKEMLNGRDAQLLAQYVSLLLGYTSDLEGYLVALSFDELQDVLRFRAILEQFYKKEKSLTFYAEGMGMTEGKLKRFLSVALGKSLSVLIKDRLHREAQELLKHTDHSVEEISDMLGFENVTSFANSFKRMAGITVYKYQKMYD